MHAAGGLGAGTAPGTSDRYPESPDWPALELELSTRYRCPRPETAGHQFGGRARLDLQVPGHADAPGPSKDGHDAAIPAGIQQGRPLKVAYSLLTDRREGGQPTETGGFR
jgi:hypothetical protein